MGCFIFYKFLALLQTPSGLLGRFTFSCQLTVRSIQHAKNSLGVQHRAVIYGCSIGLLSLQCVLSFVLVCLLMMCLLWFHWTTTQVTGGSPFTALGTDLTVLWSSRNKGELELLKGGV